MTKAFNLLSSGPLELKKVPSLNITSEFRLGNSLFLIVSQENTLDTYDNSIPSSLPGSNAYSVVGNIRINGQFHWILETKESSNNLEVNLIELLTERELQIAAFVALGHSNKEIAKKISISEWTVSTHLRRIFAKLRVDSRAAMVYLCAPLIQEILKQQSE
ncbi:MAG: response regulator transcription factor [Chloroflexaceae bacterium]|nr:response regulator transcription factor [Chloroflexaceae bacterium]